MRRGRKTHNFVSFVDHFAGEGGRAHEHFQVEDDVPFDGDVANLYVLVVGGRAGVVAGALVAATHF